MIFIVSILTIIFSIGNRLTSLNMWAPESLCFMYGIILFNIMPVLRKVTKKRWFVINTLLLLCSGFMGVIYLKFKNVYFYGDYCVKVILGVFILTFTLNIIRKVVIGNPISRFLGKISYEVYLIHGLSFYIVETLFPYIDSGVFVVISILITLVLASIAHLFSDKLIEKYSVFVTMRKKYEK